ncbi:MAG: hypothetical protein K2X00_24190 [Nitrospiraceae bacterium]|nr:hypothetical protein [Nitrospiraceae bacterium]
MTKVQSLENLSRFSFLSIGNFQAEIATLDEGVQIVKNWWYYVGQALDFIDGMADTLSAGLTARLREWTWQLITGIFGLAGIDAGPYLSIFRTDTSSAGYQAGQVVGQIVQIAITLNPGTAFAAAIFRLQMVGNAINAAEAAWNGDFRGAMGMLLSAAMSASRWLPPCITKSGVAQALGPALGKTVELAQRGMLLYGVASGVERGIDQMFSGNILQGLLSIGQSAADAYSMTRSCFTGETLVETDHGLRRIDSLKKGDRVLSRSEFDLDGPLEYKTILRTFIRVSPILNLHVNGKIIRTTAEHLFWLKGHGWLAAAFLQPGDRVAGKRPGEWLTVEGVADSGQVETVYNVEVEDHHTYFVSVPTGSATGLWAHNADAGGMCGSGSSSASPKKKTFQTYAKTNPITGEVYIGRTSGTGTPAQNVRARDKDHHMTDKGFGPAQLDKSSSNRQSIRGREQQMIKHFGGAQSEGGTSGNAINGISPTNPRRSRYLNASTKEFGEL